jgi:hypothetical protein
MLTMHECVFSGNSKRKFALLVSMAVLNYHEEYMTVD